MSTRKTKLLVLLATIAFVMACVPAIATPFPTTDPNEINTIIASTANAAATQTVAAQPTNTFTPTVKHTRTTETAEPSATSTVIFILSSPTKVVVPTFTPISSSGGDNSGSSSSANFACQVISVTPANGTNFKPRADFDTTWRVKNIGQKTWDRNSVDFVYDSGSKINKVNGYDLSNNVKVGEQIDLSVDMEAPKNPGAYTTNWTLRVGGTDFCKMSITINVK
jgi:Ig-like domain-containing protein